MTKRRQTRIIYDDDYYILQAILLSNKFKKLETQIRKELKEKDVPLADHGFGTAKEYYSWVRKLNEKFISFNLKIEEILAAFNIDPKNEAIIQGLKWYFYFGFKKAPLRAPYGFSSKISEDKKSAKVIFTIFSWTRKEDMGDFWQHIKNAQNDLVGSKSRNRKWETFERDFQLYELFLQVKDDLEKGIKPDPTVKSKSPYMNIVYHPEFSKLEREYNCPNLCDNVRSIVNRCSKLLKKIKLL